MGRAPCCDKANVKRGPWSPEEDLKLKEFIEKYGTGGNWIALPRKAGLKRCGKSCRLRWLNYLRPNIKHGEFSDDEDRIICSLFTSIGSRWSIIAAQLPGRTDNDIKNYWNTKLKKKLMAGTVQSSQRKTTPTLFPTINPLLQTPPSPISDLSSVLYKDCSPNYYNNPNKSLLNGLIEPFSMSSNLLNNNNNNCLATNSCSDLDLLQTQESLLMSSSNSDGSCSQMGLQSYISNIMLGYGPSTNGGDNHHNLNTWTNTDDIHDQKPNGYFGNIALEDQYDVEEVKQLISRSSGNSFFFFN